MPAMPDEVPDGPREDPPLLLHAASIAAPVVMAKENLTRLMSFISNSVLSYYFCCLHRTRRQVELAT
jgi:hypothetical protein